MWYFIVAALAWGLGLFFGLSIKGPTTSEAEKAVEKERENAKQAREDLSAYRERVERNVAKEKQIARKDTFLDLLDFFDNFSLVAANAPSSSSFEDLVQVVSMSHGEMLRCIERAGIERMEARGKPFDPRLHEAVQETVVEDLDPGTVVHEVKVGFVIDSMVVRPAQVIVSKKS